METFVMDKTTSKGQLVKFFIYEDESGSIWIRAYLDGQKLGTSTTPHAAPKNPYGMNYAVGRVLITNEEYALLKAAMRDYVSTSPNAELRKLQSRREALLNEYRRLQEEETEEFQKLWDASEADAAFKLRADYEVKILAAGKALAEFDKAHPQAKPAKPEVNPWM